MNHYRVLSAKPLEERDVLYHVQIRRWWTLWLCPKVVAIICRSPGFSMVYADSFEQVRDIFLMSSVLRYLDLVGQRERRDAAAIKAKYQQKGLDR